MNKEQLKELTIKILEDKVGAKISHINKHCPRPFIAKADKLSFSLTARQFGVMRDFIQFYDGMRYRGTLKFKIDGWNFVFSYISHPCGNEAYDVIVTHDVYDEDFWFTHDSTKYVKEVR